MYLKLLVPNTLGKRKTWLLQHLGDGSWRGTWSFLILNGCLVSEVEIRENKTRCKQDVPLFATKYKTSLIVDYKGTPLNSTVDGGDLSLCFHKASWSAKRTLSIQHPINS